MQRQTAVTFLGRQSVPMVLSERNHADGSWEDLPGATARLPAPPNLIVFSRLGESPSLPGAAGNAVFAQLRPKSR